MEKPIQLCSLLSYNISGTRILRFYSLDFGRRFDIRQPLDFILQSHFNSDFKAFLLPLASI